MKKSITFLLASLISLSVILSAQNPKLPIKAELSTTLHGVKMFTNADNKDTISIPLNVEGDYSVEVKAKVNSAVGRGMDMEARSNTGKGFRTSVNTSSFLWTASLANTEGLTYSSNNVEQTFRYAVTNGLVYIYQNGVFVSQHRLQDIKDIQADDTESESSMVYTDDVIGNWAGANNAGTGKPTEYGWSASSTAIPWNTASGGGGVRYENVTHTLDAGGNYVGRLLTIRWDNGGYSSATYFYPVTLEANTSYDFSFLYELWGSASGTQTLTVGIGTNTDAASIYDSKILTTPATTQKLKEGNFTFTSKEAGQYYLTFNGTWAMFGIGRLSLKGYSVLPRFIFGKNYTNGAVDMQISSITFDEGAYAPVDETPTTAQQDLTLSEKNVTAAMFMNSNIILSGETYLHLTNPSNPLVNSGVNLNAEKSWVFFDNIRPSEVISKQLGKIKVNGAVAVNNANVRVSQYGAGTVVLPIPSNPLEVFTGVDFSGSSKSLEIHTYHKNLGELDNKIRSFKLKRGYMATFANNSNGTGYSRVFVADENDIEMNLPELLDETVSFIRVFKWNWVSKKGWCQTGGGSKDGAEKTQSTWFYSWSADQASTDNLEYVPIRQNEWWPGWGEINGKQNVTHLLGFNEPDRPDQAFITYQRALEIWPGMMESGLRISSPVPSNPGNGNGWLYSFLDECDRLNYRVDYVVVHAYWGGKSPQNWYNDLKREYERCGKRPLWITEWNNGANWTNESWPTDPETQKQKQLNDLKGILQVLDTASFIERYSIYNWVEDKRAIILGENLTPAGEYYADNQSQLAFKTKNEVVPTWKVHVPVLKSVLLSDNNRISLSWNGVADELITKYIVERKLPQESNFTEIQQVDATTGNMQYTDVLTHQAQYRVKVITRFESKVGYSNVIVGEKDLMPNAPSGLKGVAISTTIIDLSWAGVEDARYYNIKRSLSAEGVYETIKSKTNLLVFTDKNLTENSTYYYKVSSINYAGEGVDSDAIIVMTKPLAVPAVVTGVMASSADKKVTLNWDFMYDAEFVVKRSESASGTFVDLKNVGVKTSYIDLSVENGKTYYYVITAKNVKGESGNSAVVSAEPNVGLHAYWKFDEKAGSLANDIWGGYNADLKANVTWNATGKYGAAVAFDGTSESFLQLKNGVVSSLDDFTIATWAYLDELSINSRIFDFGSGTGTFMMLCPNTGTASAPKIRYKITYGGKNDTFEIEHKLPTKAWVHIAISKKENELTIYVDGKPIGSQTVSLKPSGMGSTTSNYMFKSQWPNDPFFKGMLDDFRIYNYGMSDELIGNIMNNKPLPSGVKEVRTENEIQVVLYPNPVSDVLNINFTSEDVNLQSIEIFNNTGQKVMSEKVNHNSDYSLNLGDLLHGVYIVKITSNKGLLVKQILKK